MFKSGYIRRAAALTAALFVLSFSGCGSEEIDAYASKVLQLTITPAPSPTPAPVVKYPEATASKDGITMVNSYLAAASDGVNPYAGKAAEVNAAPDEPELPEDQTEGGESTDTEETAETQSSGIASYYNTDGSEEGAGYDESYDYDSGYYDSGYDYDSSYDYDSGYYDNGYDYDSDYYDSSYDYDSGYSDYDYDYSYDYGY